MYVSGFDLSLIYFYCVLRSEFILGTPRLDRGLRDLYLLEGKRLIDYTVFLSGELSPAIMTTLEWLDI